MSGVSFGRFVKTKIFEPLGMTSTSCEGRFEDVPGLATAYEPARAPDGRLDWTRMLVARPYAMSALYTAGSCVSSVEDLVRFHEGLVQGRVVNKRAMSESLEPARLAHGNADGMSLGGWQLDKIEGRRAVMLDGALPGVCTWFLMMPEEDVLVILLSNRTPGMPRCGMLAAQISSSWRFEPAKTQDGTPVDLQANIGVTFMLGPNGRLLFDTFGSNDSYLQDDGWKLGVCNGETWTQAIGFKPSVSGTVSRYEIAAFAVTGPVWLNAWLREGSGNQPGPVIDQFSFTVSVRPNNLL